MSIKELKCIERAMEIIENDDGDYASNKIWRKLKEAQDLWYEQKAKNEYNTYMKKYKDTNDLRYKQIAEENYSFYEEQKGR